MTTSHNRTHGFTLIEMMVTLVVLAIVVAIGIPSFNDTIARNNIISEANRMVASINFARSQAVAKGQVVTMQSNGDTDGNWSKGWIVFTDLSDDGSKGSGNSVWTNKDIKLKAFTQTTKKMIVRSNAMAKQFISFNSSGRIIKNGTGKDLNFSICAADTNAKVPGRLISISPVGRTNVSVITIDNKSQCTGL